MREITWKEAKSFVDSKKNPRTAATYKQAILKMIDGLNITSTEDFAKVTPMMWFDFVNGMGGKSRSINTFLRSISAFINWLNGLGVCDKTDLLKVRFGKGCLVKDEKKEYLVLTDEEVLAMIASAGTLQDRCMISLMALNGLRRSEVAGIKISDINGCHITVLSKGGSRDTIRLNEEMCEMLQKYLTEERETDSEYLFYSTRGGVTESGSLRGETINNRVQSAGRRSGMPEERLKKLSAHALRHCFITNIVRTSGIYQASRAARHSNPNITRLIYDHTGSEIAHQAVMNQRKLNIMSVAGE